MVLYQARARQEIVVSQCTLGFLSLSPKQSCLWKSCIHDFTMLNTTSCTGQG